MTAKVEPRDILIQGMRPGIHMVLLWANWLIVLLVNIVFLFDSPDIRAIYVFAILILPALVVVTSIVKSHWRELVIHIGMAAAILVGLALGWAPIYAILLFLCTSVLTVVFLNRPWGGWYIAFKAVFATALIALIMMGYGAKAEYPAYVLVAVFTASAIMVSLNAYAIPIKSRTAAKEMKRARDLVSKMQEVHRQFADAIFHAPDLHEALWHVVDLCIPVLGLEDCVIYLFDEKTNELEQVAAYGPKSLTRGEILSPLKIKVGHGVVGQVAKTLEPLMVGDTTEFGDYILDDDQRFSELAVPILFEGKLFGVIDSEHRKKFFFNEDHLALFRVISSLCSNKITELHLTNSKVEQARAERELGQINEIENLRNTFLNNLSHDLRTPLSLIRGPLQELHKKTDPDVKKLSNVALRNAERLNEMVSGLLDMHKLERGGLEVYPAPAELSSRIREWHALFIHEAERRQIDYHLDIPKNVKLRCDISKIGQIVQNLLSNAFKFTPNGGTIALTVKLVNGQISFCVQDSGPGIAPEQREKVFERFYKVDSNSHIEGTGLGLAMVKEFSEMMNGSVEITDSKLGGTLICAVLPAERIDEKYDVKHSMTDSHSEKPIVVVVEDHPEMNDFITSLLRDQYEVHTALNAEEGWVKISSIIPDLVITDLMLPGMSGEMLCKRVKQSAATDHLPVLALSAKQSTDTKIELYNYGADNYLTKPFDSEELRSVVQGLITQRQNLKQKFEGSQPELTIQSQGMRQIDKVIHQEIKNSDFGPRQLEKTVGLNRNQLQRKIKSITGYTPVEYIRIKRLEHARKLLFNAEVNVSEAAFASGFNQLAYFSKMYKAHFGISPSEDLVRK